VLHVAPERYVAVLMLMPLLLGYVFDALALD
jgi:hypothetical protein